MQIPLLTPGESKVYKALVELGESSVGNILKQSGVSHSKIYDILKRLGEKGLVSTINRRGRQYFSPSPPSALKKLITEEKSKLDQAQLLMNSTIEKLNVRKNTSSPLSPLTSFEGFKGMKTVLDNIIDNLKKGDEIFILGAPKKIGEQAGGYIKDWQKRRIKKRAVCKIITNKDAPSWNDKTYSWWKKSKKDKLTFTKRSDQIAPAYLVITKTSVTTIYFAVNILSFTVEHRDIAKSYIEFFKQLWKA